MESPKHPFRGHLPLAYTWPRPQAQPGGIAGWGMSGRAGKESDPRTSPAGGGQGPEGPSSLPPLWQSSASWAGWTGFCGCPGWGHLPVGASQGPGAGNLACLSPHVVRPMTCLPTPRDWSCHAASHQGSGEGCHRDLSVLRGQLASSSCLPHPGNIKAPGAGLDAPPAHALPCLTPGPSGSAPPASHAGMPCCPDSWETGLAQHCVPTSTEPGPQRQGSGEQHTADIGTGVFCGKPGRRTGRGRAVTHGWAGPGAGPWAPTPGNLPALAPPTTVLPTGPSSGSLSQAWHPVPRTASSCCLTCPQLAFLSSPWANLRPQVRLS